MNPYMLPTVHASSSNLNVASAVLKPFYPTSWKITFEVHIGYHATRLAAYRWTAFVSLVGDMQFEFLIVVIKVKDKVTGRQLRQKAAVISQNSIHSYYRSTDDDILLIYF